MSLPRTGTGLAANIFLVQHSADSDLKIANEKQQNFSPYKLQKYDCQH